MTENQVEKQIIAWMQARNWRRHRNHVGVFTAANGARITIGRPGYPDWSFHRPVGGGRIEICHVEAKRPGAKPSKPQLEQIALLNHLGEPAWWADSLDSHWREYVSAFNYERDSLVPPSLA